MNLDCRLGGCKLPDASPACSYSSGKETMRTPAIAITGRFQPFHNDHLELTLSAFDDCGHVIVGITNPDARSRIEDASSPHRHREDANPFSYFERQTIVTRSLALVGLKRSQFVVVPFPLEASALWHDYIPPHVVQLVRTFTKWEDKKIDMLRSGATKCEELRATRGRGSRPAMFARPWPRARIGASTCPQEPLRCCRR